MEKIFKTKILSFSILFIIIFLCTGYSAFSSSLFFEDVAVNIRTEADIRVTGVSLDSATAGVLAEGENYSVNSILTDFTLPSSSSTITYKVSITNFESPEMGIYSISGLPDNLDYSISGYTLKDKICDNSGNCNLGITKDIYVTIKYKTNGYDSSQTSYSTNIKFDFREIFSVSYVNITNNNYPSYIISGGQLSVDLSSLSDYNGIRLYYTDGAYLTINEDYTFTNGKLVVSNVSDNLTIKKFPLEGYAVYSADDNSLRFYKNYDIVTVGNKYNNLTVTAMYTGIEEANYSSSNVPWSTYKTNITSVVVVEEITPKYMSYWFSNLTNVSSIDLTKLNTSNVINMNSTFYNCNIHELDLSSWNTSNVTDMTNMFYGANKLERITVGANFSFKGNGTTSAVLPTPSASYISGADGRWYNASTNVGYAPADVPSNVAATYTAISPMVTIMVVGEGGSVSNPNYYEFAEAYIEHNGVVYEKATTFQVSVGDVIELYTDSYGNEDSEYLETVNGVKFNGNKYTVTTDVIIELEVGEYEGGLWGAYIHIVEIGTNGYFMYNSGPSFPSYYAFREGMTWAELSNSTEYSNDFIHPTIDPSNNFVKLISFNYLTYNDNYVSGSEKIINGGEYRSKFTPTPPAASTVTLTVEVLDDSVAEVKIAGQNSLLQTGTYQYPVGTVLNCWVEATSSSTATISVNDVIVESVSGDEAEYDYTIIKDVKIIVDSYNGGPYSYGIINITET